MFIDPEPKVRDMSKLLVIRKIDAPNEIRSNGYVLTFDGLGEIYDGEELVELDGLPQGWVQYGSPIKTATGLVEFVVEKIKGLNATLTAKYNLSKHLVAMMEILKLMDPVVDYKLELELKTILDESPDISNEQKVLLLTLIGQYFNS